MKIKTKKGNRRTGIVLPCILICVALAVGETEQTNEMLSADFIKTKNTGSAVDTIKGTLFHLNNRIIIKVTKPILQFMVIDSTTTLIYNVNEQAAFEMRSRSPAVLPFFQLFIGLFQNNRITLPPEFRMETSTVKNDTLFTSWVPNPKIRRFQGRFETAYYKDRPVIARINDKKGTILSEIRFSHDTLISGRPVPLRMHSTMIQPGGGTLYENIEFCRLAADKNIPAEISGFKIPSHIPVKVLEW